MLKQGSRRPQWNEDGAGGKDDPRTSERILMEWLLTPGNYARYRGKNNEETKKSQYALQIAALINAENVKVNRTAKDVINKIQYLEKSFKSAWDYANSVTGAGVREDDPETFEAKLEEKCYYYTDLLPIMGDRSGNNPGINSDLLDNSSEDEEELEDLQEPHEKDDPVEESPGTLSGTTSQPATNSSVAAAAKRRQSYSPASTRGASRMVSFLDEEPQASIRELTQTCKESTRLEMEQCQMDMANCNLDYKMAA